MTAQLHQRLIPDHIFCLCKILLSFYLRNGEYSQSPNCRKTRQKVILFNKNIPSSYHSQEYIVVWKLSKVSKTSNPKLHVLLIWKSRIMENITQHISSWPIYGMHSNQIQDHITKLTKVLYWFIKYFFMFIHSIAYIWNLMPQVS